MNLEKITLDQFWQKLETIAPAITKEPGYMKHVPLSALRFAKWARRFQRIANQNMALNNGHLLMTDFDTETTGLDPDTKFASGLAGITDIGAAKIIDGKYVGNKIAKSGKQSNAKNQHEYQSLANPGVVIPKATSEVTHITNEMVAQAPSQYNVLRKFKAFSKDTILVGHNIGDALQNKGGYDLHTVLGPIFGRYFNQSTQSLLNGSIDTLPMFQALVAGTDHTNTSFAKLLGIKLVGAHRAMPDVRVNALAFSKLIELFLQLDVNELEAFAQKKLDAKNFMLNALRPGAKIEAGKQTNWIEFRVTLDKRFNIGNRRSRAVIKYDIENKEFIYPSLLLDDGTLLTPNQAKKAMPTNILKRQAKIYTKTKSFSKIVASFDNVVF